MSPRLVVAAAVLAVAASLTGCTAGTDLSVVAETCSRAVAHALGDAGGEYTAGDFLELGDDGSLSVSSPVRGQLGAAITGVAVGCIIRQTDAPASVEAQLRSTAVGDGRREISWQDLTMAYRFLPKKGLSAVVRLS